MSAVRAFKNANKVKFKGDWEYSSTLRQVKKYSKYCLIHTRFMSDMTIETLVSQGLELTQTAIKQLN